MRSARARLARCAAGSALRHWCNPGPPDRECPPVCPRCPPPNRYRRKEYMTPEGAAAIEEWYAGFRHGAATAMASGLRNLVVIPVQCPPKFGPDDGFQSEANRPKGAAQREGTGPGDAAARRNNTTEHRHASATRPGRIAGAPSRPGRPAPAEANCERRSRLDRHGISLRSQIMVRFRHSRWTALLLCMLLASSALSGGCASFSNPTAHEGIPVHRLPPEVFGRPREEEKTIPLTLLRQKQEEEVPTRRRRRSGRLRRRHSRRRAKSTAPHDHSDRIHTQLPATSGDCRRPSARRSSFRTTAPSPCR